MVMLLTVWGFIAYLFTKKEEFTQINNMKRELLRVREYREVQYIYIYI